ncbi:MAG: 3-deoxy-D-manno-octulosonic acid transferase [Acidobacteria bacterium]|nr:3-deoxy-D-manno-octulosonic acid transferase [Acidobacteriota bacterium]
MYFLYSFALAILFALLLPYFLFQGCKHGKYFGSFKERLGHLPDAILDSSKPTLWVHTVSVGEFNAARPLLAQLKNQFAQYRLVVSTTTMTGQSLARAACPQPLDAVFYFPFDWNFSVRRALDKIQPAAVIILETELWPNFLRECRKRRIKTLVVNGRISPRSFARYSQVRNFIRRVLNDVTLLVMQSPDDAERAQALGAPASRLQVCGNLKYDVSIPSLASGVRRPASAAASAELTGQPAKRDANGAELDARFNLSASKHLLVAGSTASGEEEILLQALREIHKQDGLEDTRLLIAPRRPERFNEVAKLIADNRFTLARRSEHRRDKVNHHAGPLESRDEKTSPESRDEKTSPESRDKLVTNVAAQTAEVILLDSIGELAAVYEFAAVVFVGGSLVAVGGHNIIEPAAFAKPIVVGAHTENFRQIIGDFAHAEAVVQINTTAENLTGELTRALIRLLSDTEAAQAMGERAAKLLLENRGATDCALAAIRDVLNEADRKP